MQDNEKTMNTNFIDCGPTAVTVWPCGDAAGGTCGRHRFCSPLVCRCLALPLAGRARRLSGLDGSDWDRPGAGNVLAGVVSLAQMSSLRRRGNS